MATSTIKANGSTHAIVIPETQTVMKNAFQYAVDAFLNEGFEVGKMISGVLIWMGHDYYKYNAMRMSLQNMCLFTIYSSSGDIYNSIKTEAGVHHTYKISGTAM